MGTYGTLSARQWLQLAALGLAVAVTIVVILAVVLPTAAIVLALALAATGIAFVAQRATAAARAAARAAAHTVPWAPAPEAAPQPTLRLELPDGEVISARPVALPHEGEHTMLLTRDGYVMVNAEGRVIYRY